VFLEAYPLTKCYGFFSCRNLSRWDAKGAGLVLGKLHPWEGPGSFHSLEMFLGTLPAWFNSSHRMQVVVGANCLLSLLCPSSPLLSVTSSN